MPLPFLFSDDEMSTLKQQAVFFFVALLSMLLAFIYQEDVSGFFKLKDVYLYPRLYKYTFAVLVNYSFISLIYLFLRKTWITLFVSQFIVLSLNLINIKKEQYLSASLVPTDFLLFKETFIAAPFLLKASAIFGILIFIGIVFFLYRKEKKESFKILIPNTLISMSILGFFVSANFTNNFSEYCKNSSKAWLCINNTVLPNTSGDWVGDHITIKNTGFMTFFVSKSLDSVNTKIFKTENIPEEKIAHLFNSPTLQAEASTAITTKDKILPNIVFVMSEAHWDATQLDSSIPRNITPTIKKYQVSNMLSPSFGGGTANVEFEVLTSLNTYLNHNELAYVSKLKRSTYSLPMYMNSLGYDTTAMHNNGKYFYNRSAVYQSLGFNRFTSIENMVSATDRKKFTNAGGWANDDLIYQNIHSQLQKSPDQPQFIYAITVENHFNYNDDRYGEDNFKITKKDVTDLSKRQLNTYLSGMQRADQHFKTLIDTAKKIERPTIVIFFGDHLPNLGTVFDDYGFYANEKEQAEKQDERFFSTPLAVWSNFDLDHKALTGSHIPAHFLAYRVLEAAHVLLSPYYAFIQRVNNCYRKIHQTGVETRPECGKQAPEILQQYKDLNMDALNGKNFSYEILNAQAH